MSNPADHSFWFDEDADYYDQPRTETGKPCDHIPMKAALDDQIGCIKCGKWLGRQQ